MVGFGSAGERLLHIICIASRKLIHQPQWFDMYQGYAVMVVDSRPILAVLPQAAARYYAAVS
jgi:hypothetical protein